MKKLLILASCAFMLGMTSCNRRGAVVMNKIINEASRITGSHNANSGDFCVTIRGNEVHTSAHKWVAMSVQGNSSYTIVVMQCYPKSAPTWVCSSGTEFIEDCQTGQRYYITGSDIGMGQSNRTILNNSNPYSFYEYYPALPANVRVINISSGNRYYAKNIKIR